MNYEYSPVVSSEQDNMNYEHSPVVSSEQDNMNYEYSPVVSSEQDNMNCESGVKHVLYTEPLWDLNVTVSLSWGWLQT